MSNLNSAMVSHNRAFACVLTALALTLTSCSTSGRDQANAPASMNRPGSPGSSMPVRFAIVSDRTGGHRPGVFKTAVAKLNLLAPDFVMSVGDFIEGYTTDTVEIDREWEEFTRIIENLEPPFHYVPGNHDLSNEALNAEWHSRFGPTYYAFVHHDCLFLCLNSEDPTSGHLGENQLEYMERALHWRNRYRWTFVFMHEPLWTYGHDTGWDRMETLLGNRPRTVFAGHMHTYLREVRHGYEYITLGTTGGGGPMRGVNYGEVDHIVWVTMADGPPRIAALELGGVWDTSMYTKELKESFAGAIEGRPLVVEPVLYPSQSFTLARTPVWIENPTPYSMTVSAHVDATGRGISIEPEYLEFVVPAGETVTREIEVSTLSSLPTETVPASAIAWQAKYEVLARPPIVTAGTAKVLVLPEGLTYVSPVLPDGASAAEIVDSLYETQHEELAATAVGVYMPCTATTADALALIKSARTIDFHGEMGTALGFVCDWFIGRPLAWKFSDGLRSELPGNLAPSHAPSHDASANDDGAWHAFQGNHDTGVIDLLSAVGDHQDATVFAATTVSVDEGGEAVMHLRSDDGVALWLNGERVHANNVTRGIMSDEDHVPVNLRRGHNAVVLEITQGIEGWAFSVRLTRPDGTPYPFTAP